MYFIYFNPFGFADDLCPTLQSEGLTTAGEAATNNNTGMCEERVLLT